jgi:hypothetical protein
MSDPTAHGDGEDAVGDLSSTAAASAVPDGRPGGVGRASALRGAEAPRGKMGTPGSNRPMITTVAPWALPSRTGTATGARRGRAPRVSSFAMPTRSTAPKEAETRVDTSCGDAPADENDENDEKQKETEPKLWTTASNAPPLPPRAFLNECPGLSDRDSRLDVRYMTYGELFKRAKVFSRRITIPTFQRAFCWTSTLATRFFRDVALRRGSSAARVKGGHGTGKCLFRKSSVSVSRPHGNVDPERIPQKTQTTLLCLDGQQRCATVALAVAAIRDAAENALASMTTTTTRRDDDDAVPSFDDESRRRRAVLEATARDADSVLFLDDSDDSVTGGFDGDDRDYVLDGEGTSRVSYIGIDGPDIHRRPNRRPNRGRSLSRLTTIRPSRADRAAFAACVGVQKNGDDKKTARETDAVTAKRCDSDQTTHFMVAAKRALDVEASRLTPSALADALEATLNEASLTYVEILGPDDGVDLAQAFQWLQEKTLFAASAVLWNATPGVTFAACDLVRNYLLASTLNGSVEAQEATHAERWFEPLESRIRFRGVSIAENKSADGTETNDRNDRTHHPSAAFDAFLKAFLDDDDARFASSMAERVVSGKKTRRRASAVERDLRRMLASEHAPESTKRSAGADTAVWTYARFRSFAERVAMGREDETTAGGSDDDDASDASPSPEAFRVDFTTSAPPPSWEGPAPADGPPGPPGGKNKNVLSRDPSSDPSSTLELLAREKKNAEPRRERVVPVDDAALREIVRRLVEFGEKAGFLRVSSVDRADADRFLGDEMERRDATR